MTTWELNRGREPGRLEVAVLTKEKTNLRILHQKSHEIIGCQYKTIWNIYNRLCCKTNMKYLKYAGQFWQLLANLLSPLLFQFIITHFQKIYTHVLDIHSYSSSRLDRPSPLCQSHSEELHSRRAAVEPSLQGSLSVCNEE